MSPVTEYLLDPSVRVEAMVQFPTASEYVLKTEKVRTGPAGDGYPATDLTTILCEGPAVKPVALPQARAACCAGSVEDYTKLNIDNKRLIVFNETDSDFRVNDKIFDEDRIDTRVALGTVEEWTISHSTDVFLTTRDGRVVKRFDLIAPAEEIAREARLAVEKHAALPAAGAPAIVTANVGGQP
jgi:FtsP/CotA-like multicopper oxidase with cupredoxin domain